VPLSALSPRPVTHGRKAVGSQRPQPLERHAYTVIPNPNEQPGRLQLDRNLHAVGMRVLEDVGQGFLDDPEDDNRGRWREA